ncbi:MAG: hypothetical protein DWQ37_20975 [Planctomycetota bacterium]|nr:MAG: hypothetical protein DWQ37_20975 [Planctomycetota bacterium]
MVPGRSGWMGKRQPEIIGLAAAVCHFGAAIMGAMKRAIWMLILASLGIAIGQLPSLNGQLDMALSSCIYGAIGAAIPWAAGAMRLEK